MENPYSLVFGKLPANFIDRGSDVEEIIDTFKEAEPSLRTYIITGIRGCGKTVALSKIEKEFRENKDFLVLSLNCDLDLITYAAEELCSISKKYDFFQMADITLSLPGITIGKSAATTAESPSLVMDKLLDRLTGRKKRVLFCIDEVSNTKNVRSFCQAFNVWLRKDYDVLLLITGLKNNVINLQGDKSVSFLKRAERVELGALSINAMLRDYQSCLGLSEEEAAQMALITKGYSYAFQLLGYLCFKNQLPYTQVLQQFEDKLSDNVYDLIWRDLTAKEKELVTAIIEAEKYTAKDIMSQAHFSQNSYNLYRNILITKGLINNEGYGKISFALPRFAEIASRNLRLGLWMRY